MRCVYVVDVHDRVDAVVDAVAEVGDVDLLLVGGDITTAGSVEQVDDALDEWLARVPRVLAVAGNMDSPAIDALLAERGVSLDGRGETIGDVGIFGVSAAPFTPFRTPYEVPDEELIARAAPGAAAVRGARVRIFCPHAPPVDTVCDRLQDGRHVGSAAIRDVVEREQPGLVLCGHIHEGRGEDTIGTSRIVNPGPAAGGHYAVVEIDGAAPTVRLD